MLRPSTKGSPSGPIRLVHLSGSGGTALCSLATSRERVPQHSNCNLPGRGPSDWRASVQRLNASCASVAAEVQQAGYTCFASEDLLEEFHLGRSHAHAVAPCRQFRYVLLMRDPLQLVFRQLVAEAKYDTLGAAGVTRAEDIVRHVLREGHTCAGVMPRTCAFKASSPRVHKMPHRLLATATTGSSQAIRAACLAWLDAG